MSETRMSQNVLLKISVFYMYGCMSFFYVSTLRMHFKRHKTIQSQSFVIYFFISFYSYDNWSNQAYCIIQWGNLTVPIKLPRNWVGKEITSNVYTEFYNPFTSFFFKKRAFSAQNNNFSNEKITIEFLEMKNIHWIFYLICFHNAE